MTEPDAPELSTVLPVDVPFVEPVKPRRPWPGWWASCLLTLGFWAVSIAAVVVFVVAVLGYQLVRTGTLDRDGLDALFLPLVGWMIVGCYAANLAYDLIALDLGVGRGWVRQVGLLRLPPAHLALAALALPGFMAASEGVERLLSALSNAVTHSAGWGDVPKLEDDLDQAFTSYHWSFAVLAIAVGPALVEELWCRAFLGRGLLGRYGRVAGVALTSILFGVMHLWTPAHVVTTGLMGAGLHVTYLLSRSLWVPIAIHFGNNAFGALQATGVVDTAPIEQALGQSPAVLYLAAVGLLLSAGLAMWTARGRLVDGEGRPAAATDPGVIVPSIASGLRVVHRTPSLPWTGWAVVFCAGLVYRVYG